MKHIPLMSGLSVVGKAARLAAVAPHACGATKRKATEACMVFTLASGLAANPCWSWDVTPTGLLAFEVPVTVPTAKGVASAVASGTSFDEGTPLRLLCSYKYQGGTDKSPPWHVEFVVDGQPVGSVQAAPGPNTYTSSHTSSNCAYVVVGCSSTTTNEEKIVDETHHAEVKWMASGDGARTVQCQLNPKKAAGESNPYNNIAQQTITVKRLKPLSGGELPPVQLAVVGASFVLGPALQIPLSATVAPQPTGGKANVIEYAKASPFEEKWHIEIVRRGSGGLGAFESKIGEFSGPLNNLNFGAQLSQAWLQQKNFVKAGNYAARAFVSQSANGAIVTGPNSRVEFELKEALPAQVGMQPQTNVNLSQPVAPVFNPFPPQPAGRSPSPQPQPVAPAAPAGSMQPIPVLPNLPAVQLPHQPERRRTQ